jgi:hypothetical protein
MSTIELERIINLTHDLDLQEKQAKELIRDFKLLGGMFDAIRNQLAAMCEISFQEENNGGNGNQREQPRMLSALFGRRSSKKAA